MEFNDNMNFGEKIKSLRKDAGMSQEKFAEKVGVSRQAITKWETNGGLPDIDNMVRIAAVFNISLDELLAGRRAERKKDYLYRSTTEYDIDALKHYDIHLGCVKDIKLFPYEGEKLIIHLVSNEMEQLEHNFKVKLDDRKKDIDIDVVKDNQISDKTSKEQVSVLIKLPKDMTAHTEIEAITGTLIISNLHLEHFEFDGKVEQVQLEAWSGNVEINSLIDMEINCKDFNGRVEVNQLFSTSTLNLPVGTKYQVGKIAKTSRVSYSKDGTPCDAPVFETNEEIHNIIDVTGRMAELVINENTGQEVMS